MATPTFRAGNVKNSSSGTSCALTKPTGTASGDVLYAIISMAANKTVTAPSGWTQIGTSYNGTSTFARFYRKVAGGSEPSSYSWSWSGSTTNVGVIVAW